MTDVKIDYVTKVALGYDSTNADTALAIVRFSDRLVSPDGAMVEPVSVINTVKPATVGQRASYYEMELELDSDNSMFYDQQVTSGVATSRALRDSAANGRIDYFIVNLKDTAGATVSYLYETQRVYLTGASGRVSNEKGTERNPTIYRLICRGNKTVGNTDITAKGGASKEVQYTGISSVVLNAGANTTAVNILEYEWEFVGPDGSDILDVRTTPNTYEGVGVTEWSGKHWRLKLTFDSYTDIFDSYIEDDAVNPVIAAVVNVVMKTAAGSTQVHSYETSKCYISNVDGETVEKATRNPVTYELVCIGTRSVY